MRKRCEIGWAILLGGILIHRIRSFDTAVTVASDAAIEPTRARQAQSYPDETLRHGEVVRHRVAKANGGTMTSTPVVRSQGQRRKSALEVDHGSIEISVSADAAIETASARDSKAIPDETLRQDEAVGARVAKSLDGTMPTARVVRSRAQWRNSAVDREVDHTIVDMTSTTGSLIGGARVRQPEAILEQDLKHDEVAGSRITKEMASTTMVRPRVQWRKPTFEHEVVHASATSIGGIRRAGWSQTVSQGSFIQNETAERGNTSQKEIQEPSMRPNPFPETTSLGFYQSWISQRVGAALSWIRIVPSRWTDFLARLAGPDMSTHLSYATLAAMGLTCIAAAGWFYYD